MQVSDRLLGLTGGGSDGWGLFMKARAMVAEGIAVTELTIGEHDVRTDPAILEAMAQAARAGHTGYAAVPGTPALRAAIAARVQARTVVPTGVENVLVTPGGQAGLFAAHLAACAPGDPALFIDPYYATYPGTLRAGGAVPVAVPARSRDAFQPRAEAIDARAEGAKSLLINTPNNPTGVVYTPQTLAGIAEVCRARDLWLISDEVYDTQVWEGAHVSPRALPGMAERTLVVGSMSKSHAMTGSRIGWIIGPAQAIAPLETLATHTTYGVPGYIQDAALFALSQGAALEARIAAPFKRRRAIAMKLLAAQDVVRLIPAGGAMYLMLDVRSTGLSGKAFAEALLARHRIAVMPGESFGACAAGHLRVAMTVEDDAFAAALQTLIDFAKECAACPATQTAS
ncbi:pyridoxal phosphate-dependent aminotransferase [Pseudoruegeria sp. SHC-113]|uniref:pyridoxal phosphate-dependent aminotransferase n=1 Tax=Pseudoruegeria sp. SHC-113 TaxID=2855439 RepID=UPI0021BB7B3C|nr:pyridoxal phosphate-dependent aminotransferase [Pseudoruegeria sp. SHC-113]MCT8160597.1 pyridoxal phosphate-dependent aminotransferase [Pseudoruegeria sp. SHC-113]